MKNNEHINKLILGDNLDILKTLPNESVDLIYLDPPVMAIKVSDQRLKKQAGMFSQPYDLVLRKYDYDLLRHKDAFEFESWIITQFDGKQIQKFSEGEHNVAVKATDKQGLSGTDKVKIKVKK